MSLFERSTLLLRHPFRRLLFSPISSLHANVDDNDITFSNSTTFLSTFTASPVQFASPSTPKFNSLNYLRLAYNRRCNQKCRALRCHRHVNYTINKRCVAAHLYEHLHNQTSKTAQCVGIEPTAIVSRVQDVPLDQGRSHCRQTLYIF